MALVVMALLALALIPTIVLQRITRVTEGMSATILPAYDGMRDFALATERRASASRGRLLLGGAEQERRYRAAGAAEDSAMDRLEALVPRLGSEWRLRLEALRAEMARRDSVEEAVITAGAGAATFRASLPTLDRLRDSVVFRLRALEQEVARATRARLAQEQEWARVQRWLSAILGMLAMAGAVAMAWFAMVQRRLTVELQAALAEAELRRLELERVTESRARLMRGFSHDVKNPLGAAHGYLQLLEEGIMGPLTERQLRSVTRAGRSMQEALRLVEDLLELARAESGTLEVVREPTDLGALAREAGDEYRAQAEAKGLTLEVQTPPTMLRAETDGRRIKQVLGNFLSNAVKYTSAGGVVVRVERRDGLAVLAVSDTGPGIPPEQRQRLFEEFVRLHPGDGLGAGVGLTISMRVAEALGARITLESEPGQGSTFGLEVPC